jgi:hypothetical protein
MAFFCRRSRSALLVILSLLLPGCISADPNMGMVSEAVTAIPVGESASVSAYDLAEAMLRAGFSREQVLKDGPAVRNALATSGGAQIRKGKFVDALFSVHSGRLFVTSRMRGTFVQTLGLDRPDKLYVVKAPE